MDDNTVAAKEPGFFRSIISRATPESAMRFVLVFVVIFIVVTVFGNWGLKYALCNFAPGTTVPDIPQNVAYLAWGIIAAAITGKVFSLWGEKEK